MPTAWRWLGIIWWVFPVVLVAGGYFVPALRLPVTTSAIPELMKTDLYFWLLISLVLCAIWIFAGFLHATDFNTTVAALKTDAFVSILVAIVLSATTAFLAGRNSLVWALVLPTLTAIVDALVAGNRAINNAAQKPIVQHKNIS
jgi:hypothetical protein